ncbi:MAG TPA: LysR family transcriptional regulator [Burkholderiales bacterium]|nr:LysR family transcriptional regulator [Burkholderiales bacterium]
MRSLQDLEVFVKAADTGSLSAAARALDITPAVASAALKRLEAEVDTVLFIRSTRNLRLTLEGESFLHHCRAVLATLQIAREELANKKAVIKGKLQLTAPSDLGRNQLLSWLDEFQSQYPGVQVRVQLSDRVADVYRQPVDVAIRYGEPPDSGLVALPLAPNNRRVLCAAPAYIAKRGHLESPEALGSHNCLCFMLKEQVNNKWRFYRDGAEVCVQVSGNRVADDGDAVRRWAVAGHGIAYKSYLDVAPDLAAGRLVALCPAWLGEPAPLYLLGAGKRALSPVVRLLRTYLQGRCKALEK